MILSSWKWTEVRRIVYSVGALVRVGRAEMDWRGWFLRPSFDLNHLGPRCVHTDGPVMTIGTVRSLGHSNVRRELLNHSRSFGEWYAALQSHYIQWSSRSMVHCNASTILVSRSLLTIGSVQYVLWVWYTTQELCRRSSSLSVNLCRFSWTLLGLYSLFWYRICCVLRLIRWCGFQQVWLHRSGPRTHFCRLEAVMISLSGTEGNHVHIHRRVSGTTLRPVLRRYERKNDTMRIWYCR